MRSFKIFLLIVAGTSFITVIGGAVYEHLAVVPKWKVAPPASLSMFQGEYGLDPGDFWELIHPITMILLVGCLVANWKTKRRKFIAMVIAGYILMAIVTLTYFVPELLSIIHTPYQAKVDKSLVSRAATWEKLSLLRLVFIVCLAYILLYSLTKDEDLKIYA
ncbi:MAG: hypothetical protein WDN26_23445 [Chitinophagaceae bacterium]